MSFDQISKEEQDFAVDMVKNETQLSDVTVRELLEHGWSYIQDGDGHKWTLNALEGQTVAVLPDRISIPEILIPPSGIPINAKTIHQLHEHHKLRDGERMTVEHMVLMAILRGVYAGYRDREEAAKKAQDEDLKTEPTETVTDKRVRVAYTGGVVYDYENEDAYQKALASGDEIAVYGERLSDEPGSNVIDDQVWE